MKRLACLVLAVAANLLITSDLLAQTRLFGVTFFDNTLFSVDPATGAGTAIGTLSANVTSYGLAFRNGLLFGFDPNTDRIRQINTTNAQVVSSIDIGVGNLMGEGDLTFRGDGIGYLASALNADFTPANDLFSFNIVNGTSTRIGTTRVGTTGTPLDALAFDITSGVLYALAQGDGGLYTVNQTTAALTLVGSLGVNQDSPFAALTFAPDGTLFAAIDDRVYRVNKATGAATVLDATVLDTGFGSVSGLAATVPEPTSMVLVLVGLGTMAGRARRLKA